MKLVAFSDDSALAQALALFVGETEAGQHIVGVLAQLRAAVADASRRARELGQHARYFQRAGEGLDLLDHLPRQVVRILDRSEEHTSELQSRENLVCRL